MTETNDHATGMEQEGQSHAHRAVGTSRRFLLLSLAALGVVYGDIGTSPLYALRECFHGPYGVPVSTDNMLGVLSLIFWSLILIISIKYLIFILRADNRGEGGILALTALLTSTQTEPEKRSGMVIVLGLVGAALLYADGMITPAITVLGAVEGLEIATPLFKEHPQYVIGTAVVILVGLFLFQSRGTTRIGIAFGPVVLVWFLSIAALGIWQIAGEPSVFRAINPLYGLEFLLATDWHGFLVLGSVFLVVTGGEALYADIGHFGTRPIRITWFAVVLPALLLNYFGQGAFLMSRPEGAANPFFLMAPNWALYPLVALATAAAAIASQAVITGAFSLTVQAIRLGYVSRLRVEHTSSEQIGQIYLPTINWALMFASIALVIGFQSSSNLAAAYGVAITLTMVITTVLFFLLLRRKWRWSPLPAAALAGFFVLIELSFLGANLPKIAHGGWFPLLVAAIGYILMSTWQEGRRLLGRRLRKQLIPLDMFVADLLAQPPLRVPGMAVYMFSNPVGTPHALRHNVRHNKILHETVVILCVETAEIPHVPASERFTIEDVGEGFYGIKLTYGFMEEPNVPRELRRVRHPRLDFTTTDISYFLGRETLLVGRRPGMARWRERLFTWMSRNAQAATAYFHIPPDRVFEVGVQVEL